MRFQHVQGAVKLYLRGDRQDEMISFYRIMMVILHMLYHELRH